MVFVSVVEQQIIIQILDGLTTLIESNDHTAHTPATIYTKTKHYIITILDGLCVCVCVH